MVCCVSTRVFLLLPGAEGPSWCLAGRNFILLSSSTSIPNSELRVFGGSDSPSVILLFGSFLFWSVVWLGLGGMVCFLLWMRLGRGCGVDFGVGIGIGRGVLG